MQATEMAHTKIPYLGSHSDPNLQREPIAAVGCYLNSLKSRNICIPELACHPQSIFGSSFLGISEENKALFSLHAHH